MKTLNSQNRLAIEKIVQHQIKILGVQIATYKANKIEGLQVNEKGKIIKLDGDSTKILQQLVHQYARLSGLVFKSVMKPILAKYPDLPIYID